MNRKLASIQKIINVEDISFENNLGVLEKATNIVKASVLGWHCVTQRSNNFKPGDFVIYFEIDSLIPLTPEVEFLRKMPEQTFGRIKTVRFKGQYSQGLILPISAFQNHPKYEQIKVVAEEEDADLTDILGVQKYEPPVSNGGGCNAMLGGSAGNFPNFIQKTDETRIQAAPKLLTMFKDQEFYVTEKLDGSSCTVFCYPVDSGLWVPDDQPSDMDYVFGVCSRNFRLSPTVEKNAFWQAVRSAGIEEKLAALKRPIVLQGELVGPGVQKNKLKLSDLKLYWFNVYNPKDRVFAGFKEFVDTISSLGLTTVPILDSAFKLNHTVDELVTYAGGKSVINESSIREGVVFRPLTEKFVDRFGRLSFKVISPEFLVKYDE